MNRRQGIAMGIAAPTIVGGLVAFSGFLEGYPLLGGQGARYAVAGLALALYALATGAHARGLTPSVRDVGRVVLVALVGMLGFNTAVILAVEHGDPATVGTIVGCAPLVLALSGGAAARRDPRLLGGAALVVAGAGIVQGAGGASALGVLLATGALAGEVGFSLLAVPLIKKHGALLTSIHACFAAGAIGLAAGLVVDRPSGFLPTPTGNELAALAYTSLGATTLGFVFWYGAIERLGTATAGLFLGLIPVSAFVYGGLLGTQALDPLKALGCALVGVGIVAGLRPPGAAQSNRSATPPPPSSALASAASRQGR